MDRPIFYLLDQNNIPYPVKDHYRDVVAWERELLKQRRIAEDKIGSYYISTVFLGIDHRCVGDGQPILFETMIFSKDDDSRSFDGHQRRYSTYVQAVEGHAELVKLIQLETSLGVTTT